MLRHALAGRKMMAMVPILIALSLGADPTARASPAFEQAQLTEDQLRSLDISDLDFPEGPVDTTHRAFMERIVRLAYGRLGLMVRETGYELRFELDNFRHYYPEDFDEVLWLDIVDLPEGEVIDITRERLVERRGKDHATETIRYRASWGYHDPGLSFPSERLRLATLTVQDVVAGADQAPGFGPFDAITAYRVTVHLNGKTKTYNANFAWTVAAGPETPVVVSDLTVKGVELGLSGEPAGMRPTSDSLE